MIRTCTFITLMSLSASPLLAQQPALLKGSIHDQAQAALPFAHIRIEELNRELQADEHGNFTLDNIKPGTYTIVVSVIGHQSERKKISISGTEQPVLRFRLASISSELDEVEVFGARETAPEKLDMITRLPLKPSQQIQSISVISQKLIEEQGALSITDATRNVTGVTQFGSYGGVRESMSTRGYRGVPVLKNGIRMDSDFRTGSGIVDMQGVESIQVIKGSAAITQGIGNDLGSAGGVINVVTKTPKFYTGGEVGLRLGSWGQVRPTFDLQTVVDKQNTLGVRLNGAFERADSYRPYLGKENFYINPSVAWRPDQKTTITAELDYLHNTTTPDRGTVNLAPDSVDALLDLPFDKFLGFSTDQFIAQNMTYTLRAVRDLSQNLSLRAVYFKSVYQTDQTGVGTLATLRGSDAYNIRSRSLTRSLRDDRNSGFQLDLIGKNVYTGSIKHTFQVGMDFRQNRLSTTAYDAVAVDTIDVLGTIPNVLPQSITAAGLTAQDPVSSSSYNYGFMAQDYIDITPYLTVVAGARYSFINSQSADATGKNTADNVDPMVGVMIRPWHHINLFGSYTTTTSLRSANNIQLDRVTPVGPSRSKQFEAGLKSDWLANRLRFNFTYFNILNSNLTYTEYDSSGTATGFYGLAGDLKRTGIETELSGSILDNLQLILGYAYLDARYQNSPAYVDGSAPSNAPKHTANAWIQYRVKEGALRNLSLGIGAYYVGARPVNEYTQKVVIHNTTPGVKPFDMPAYTTLNAQLGYSFGKVGTRLLFNNITDAIGYNSYYRGGYINRIDPRNFALALSYRF